MIPSALLLASLSLFPHAPMDLTLTLPAAPIVHTVKPQSKDSRTQQIVRAAILVVCAGLDIDSTHRMIQAGGGEQTRWLYGPRPGLRRLIFGKALFNVPMLYLAHKAAEIDRADGLMPVVISGARQALAAGLNYHLLPKQRAITRDEKGPGK